MTTPVLANGADNNSAPRTGAYRWCVVAMLWLVCLFNYADRQAIFSVFPLLEEEMGLSNADKGMLGASFALVYGLGSPFAGDVRATNATRLYEALSGEAVEDNAALRAAISGDLPVPTTSIYSRSDGIVNWRTCHLRPSDTAENIEVYLASHVGLGVNAAALWAVADRLAQTEGEFKQFDRSGPFAIAYAPPETAQSRPMS